MTSLAGFARTPLARRDTLGLIENEGRGITSEATLNRRDSILPVFCTLRCDRYLPQRVCAFPAAQPMGAHRSPYAQGGRLDNRHHANC